MKHCNFLKKIVLVVLASTIGLNSGSALTNFCGLSSNNTAHGYFGQDYGSQTRLMMTADNFLKDGFYMEVNYLLLTSDQKSQSEAKRSLAAESGARDLNIYFTLPNFQGDGSENLIAYIMNRDSSRSGSPIVCPLKWDSSTERFVAQVLDLFYGSYAVEIYRGSKAAENFVAKSEFASYPDLSGLKVYYGQPLLDSKGSKIVVGGLEQHIYLLTPDDTYPFTGDSKQYYIAIPEKLVPKNIRTIKAVFFAKESQRGTGEYVDINKYLSDYFTIRIVEDPTKKQGKQIVAAANYLISENKNDKFLVFVCPALDGIAESVDNEVHFYADSVLEKNFLSKAIGVWNWLKH